MGRTLLTVLMLVASHWGQSTGHTTPSRGPASGRIQNHFAAAQQAQQHNDYATAEREYQAVLIEAPGFAEAHMNLGLIYQLQDRAPEAMAQFRQALKIKPTLAGANFFLGVDYCKNGEGANAIPYLKAASRQQPNQPDIWSWLATAQEMSGDTAAEIATLKHAISLQPQNVDSLYLLGRAYEHVGKEEVNGLERASPGSSWSEQLLAESYSTSNEWSFAVIRFQNALAITPNRPGLHVENGEVFLHAGRLDQALDEFEHELRLDPHSLRALVRRGEVRLIQGSIDEALSDWSQAIAMDEPRAEQVLGIRETGLGDAVFEQLPDPLREQVEALAPQLRQHQDPAGRLALAFLAVQNGGSTRGAAKPSQEGDAGSAEYSTTACTQSNVKESLNQGRFSQASHCFPRILTPRSSADFRIQVAQALFELGNYQGSLDVLAGLSKADQHSPPAFYWRARCFEKLATSAYLRLYQAEPDSYRVHQLMADLAAARNNDAKAIEEYRAAVALKPSLPNLHYSLGHLLWKELSTDAARTEFEAELALNPRHSGALHDLGETYLMEHKTELALSYLKRALEVNPKDPELHRDLGTGYADLHDYAKAVPEFKIALQADKDGSLHYKLGRAYQALGRKEEATREFALSTSLNSESRSKLEKQTERLNQIEGSPQHP